jgi:hypothetical protein
MKTQDYEWAVLSQYIRNEDRLGLSLLRREWFNGMARDVYDIALSARNISIPYVLQEVDDRFVRADALEVQECLLGASKPSGDKEMLTYVKALSHKHATKAIRNTVTSAFLKLEDGESALRVRSELLADLDQLYEIAPVKDFNEMREKMKEEVCASIMLNDPRFTAAELGEIRLGNLWCIGGPSGAFKTTHTVNICDDILVSNPDAVVVYFSKEQPASEIIHKFIAMNTSDNIPYTHVIRYYNAANPSFVEGCDLELMGTCPYLDKRLIVVDPTDFSTPEDVSHILQTIDLKGKKLVWVIDFVTLLDFGKGPMVENMEKGMSKLKSIAHQTRSLGILISQLRKDWNLDFKTSKKIVMVPFRDHLMWASALVNLSAYITLLYRPFDDDRSAGKFWLFVRVDKLRFADKDNMLALKVDVENQRFPEMDSVETMEVVNYMKKKGI